MLDDKDLQTLTDCVSKNLCAVLDKAGWTQSQAALKMACSTGAINNYRKGDRLPSLEFLVKLCSMSEIQELLPKLSIEDLISDSFDLDTWNRKPHIIAGGIGQEAAHSDFLGNYLCYFFDQSKHDFGQGEQMRYGILSAYNAFDPLTGEQSIRTTLAFFVEEDVDLVLALKRDLDAVFRTHTDVSDRNAAIAERFGQEQCPLYRGIASFSDYNVFINCYNKVFHDHAQMTLYSPSKRPDIKYGGGLGSLSSATLDDSRAPMSQTFFMTKYELVCSYEEIFATMRMAQAKDSATQEGDAKALCDFCRKLYQDETISRNFADSDKEALVRNRLDQLLVRNVERNICALGCVSEDADRAARKLIEQYKKI